MKILFGIFFIATFFYQTQWVYGQPKDKVVKPHFTVKTYPNDTVYVERVSGKLEQRIVKRDADTLYDIAEHMPEFYGGEKELNNYLRNNLQYPSSAKEKKIQAKVYVSFIVDKEGIISDIEVKKIPASGEDLADEAIRLVQQMPKWKPGQQNGKKVKCLYTLPILFRLGN